MRILHTADWHLGKLFHQRHLTEDQAHALDGMLELAERLRPDLVVVAGDVFDRAVPPAEAVELLDRVLSRLILELGIGVAMIPGNHDDPARLGFGSRLMESAGLLVAAEPGTPPFLLEDEHGPVAVALLPYRHPVEVAHALEVEAGDHHAALAALVAAVRGRIPEGVRSVAVAHAWVTGGRVGESERPLTLGGAGEVPAEVFEGFSYVALGHLHRPQEVGGERLHYPGSLLPYHFSEAGGERGCTLVELDGSGAVRLERHVLEPLRGFRVVRGLFDELVGGEACEDWVQVQLEDREPVLDAAARLRERFPNLLAVVPVHREVAGEGGDPAGPAGERPLDAQFARFFEEVTGEVLEEPQETVIRELLGEAGP